MMMVHGLDKIRSFEENAAWFDQVRPLGMPGAVAAVIAIFAELGCALLVAVGWRTRLAAVPVIVTMAVAAFQCRRTRRRGCGSPGA